MRQFFEAFVLGFSVAAPVGPIGLLCIRRTLADGRAVGFASGLGAATADAVYGFIAALGFTTLAAMLTEHQAPIRLAGALYLAFLGVQTWRAPVARREAASAARGIPRAWASTFLLTITSPATIVSFAAMCAIVSGADPPNRGPVPLVTGVFLGSAAWWLMLSYGVDRMRDRLSPAHLRAINRVAGAILVGFSVVAICTR